MRKIHLPTSIKQTKFVSRIQAYRSSVYLQGFRGFTFSSTQSRQTKAESYVKYWNVKPKAPAAIKQFQVRRIFPPNRRKIDYFPFECFFFPLAYTIYACGFEFHSISFDRHFYCDMLKSFVLRSPSSCCLFPQEIYPDGKAFKCIYFNSLRISPECLLHKTWIFLYPHVVFAVFELGLFWFTKQFFHYSCSSFVTSSTHDHHMKFIIHGFVQANFGWYTQWDVEDEEVAWKFEFRLHFTSRIRHKIDFRLRARLILSFVIMTVVKRRRRISIMSSQTRSLQICVKGGEADGMEKSISVLRTLSIFHGQSLS